MKYSKELLQHLKHLQKDRFEFVNIDGKVIYKKMENKPKNKPKRFNGWIYPMNEHAYTDMSKDFYNYPINMAQCITFQSFYRIFESEQNFFGKKGGDGIKCIRFEMSNGKVYYWGFKTWDDINAQLKEIELKLRA